MPAPKLLDKKVIAASVATERKQEIDKGLKLAKAVEALQEAKEKEEQELLRFRTETIARVQLEIDAKIAERDFLDQDIQVRKRQRIELEAPIDLKEEWQKVRDDAAANASWRDSLTQHSIELLAREEDNRIFSEKLAEEEAVIKDEHELTKQALAEAEKRLSQADSALERAEREAQSILQTAQQRDNHLKVREQDATDREVALSKREEEVAAHEINLSNRERKLRVNQETFIKAKAYIKSKQK